MTATADLSSICAGAGKLAPADGVRLLAAILSLRERDGGGRVAWSARARAAISAVVEALEARAVRERNEATLVDKLAIAESLRPSFLLAALEQGRLSLFGDALARLGGFTSNQVRAAMDDPARPELLALACAAVGIDRAALPNLLARVRELNGGRPAGSGRADRRALDALGSFSRDAAARAFAQVIGTV